jgi:nicotinamide-nucleotide amidase
MAETVLPYLRGRTGSEGIIRRRILRTFGIGESIVDDRLTDLMNAANPTLGLAAHTGQVDIRIAARAESAAAAEGLLDDVEAVVRARVGQFIYSSVPDEAYETVLVRRLRERDLTLAVYETNTRGALADRLARALPDFDPVWLRVDGERNVLAWDEAVAAEFDPDRVPAADLAGLAAVRLRIHSGAAVGLALVGTAAADEGVFGQRSGETWLGLATGQAVTTTRIPFGGQDDYTIVRICNQALRRLWELADSL